MDEESCCWYACANSITFFARTITPTDNGENKGFQVVDWVQDFRYPGRMDGKGVYGYGCDDSCRHGYDTFLHPFFSAECGHGYSFSFHNGWFPFFTIEISGYWLLWSCFYRLAGFIKSPTIFLFGMAVSVFSLFRAGCYYFSILLSFAYGLVSFYLKMVVSEIILAGYPASLLAYFQAQSSPPP